MKNRLLILFVFIVSLLFQSVYSQPNKNVEQAEKELEIGKILINKAEALQIMAEIQIRQAEYYLGKNPNLIPKINAIMARINAKLRKEPKNSPYLMARGYAYYAIADFLSNKTAFGKNKLNDAKIKTNLGLASKDIEKAISFDKTMGEYFNTRGKIRIAQCNAKVFKDDDNCIEKPRQDLTNALFSSPNNHTFYTDRIDLYKAYNSKELAEADEKDQKEYEELFNETLKIQEKLETEKTEDNYYNLGQILMKTFDKTLEFPRKNRTDDDFAVENYYQNQFDLLNDAKDSYDKAFEISPNKDYLFSARGWVLVYMGSVAIDAGNKELSIKYYDLAIKDFNEEIKLNPNKSKPYKSRAFVYEQLGKTELQKADLEKANSLEKPKQ